MAPTIGVLVGVMKTDLFHEIWALKNRTSDGREGCRSKIQAGSNARRERF